MLSRNKGKIKYHNANNVSFHTLRDILVSITERLLKNLYFFFVIRNNIITSRLLVHTYLLSLHICRF